MVGVSPGSRLGVVAWKGDQLAAAVVPRSGQRLAGQRHRPGGRRGPRRDRLRADPGGVHDRRRHGQRTPATPLPGAIVQLISSTDPFERHFALRSTDGAGRMRLGPVPPGSYTLSVTPGAANPGLPARQPAAGPGCCAPRGSSNWVPRTTSNSSLSCRRVPIRERQAGQGRRRAARGRQCARTGAPVPGTAGAGPWPAERRDPDAPDGGPGWRRASWRQSRDRGSRRPLGYSPTSRRTISPRTAVIQVLMMCRSSSVHVAAGSSRRWTWRTSSAFNSCEAVPLVQERLDLGGGRIGCRHGGRPSSSWCDAGSPGASGATPSHAPRYSRARAPGRGTGPGPGFAVPGQCFRRTMTTCAGASIATGEPNPP